MCQSFQGHNREVTKVTSILCVRKLIKVWRCSELLHMSQTVYILSLLPPSICQVLCYPGSTWIFSASRDKTVLMWDLNQGDEPIQEFCGHELVVNGLAVSPGTHTHTMSILTCWVYEHCHLFRIKNMHWTHGTVFIVTCRWEKAVHRFSWQLDVPVGYWICKMWTETQHF